MVYNVILIDDEEVSIESIRQMIPWEKYGIQKVCIATNIETAKAILQEMRIDIVICDIEMSGGDGFEMIRWIKEKKYPSVNIFLTCHAEFTYAQKAMKLGIIDYVLKPVIPEDFGEVLEKAIEQIKEQEARFRVQAYATQLASDYLESDEHNREMKNAEVVAKVKKYIEEHLSYNITRQEIAEYVFLNKDYLSKIFKEETGMPIVDYIIKKKMNVACELLSTTRLSVSKVAECIGYTHMPYFSKMFKRETGMTPNEYRSHYKGGNR